MSNIKVDGLYIYQPFPSEHGPYIYGIGNLPFYNNTQITGISKEEAEQILLLLERTRGLKINENTKRKLNCS